MYPGVDLEISGESGQFEWRWVLEPGARLPASPLRIERDEEVSEGAAGFEIRTALGKMSLHAPGVYGPDGNRLPMKDTRRRQAGIGDLVYTTYFGGIRDTSISDVQRDAAGALFFVGSTHDPDFPPRPAGAPKPPGLNPNSYRGGSDVYVAKLNAAGTLVCASYI